MRIKCRVLTGSSSITTTVSNNELVFLPHIDFSPVIPSTSILPYCAFSSSIDVNPLVGWWLLGSDRNLRLFLPIYNLSVTGLMDTTSCWHQICPQLSITCVQTIPILGGRMRPISGTHFWYLQRILVWKKPKNLLILNWRVNGIRDVAFGWFLQKHPGWEWVPVPRAGRKSLQSPTCVFAAPGVGQDGQPGQPGQELRLPAQVPAGWRQRRGQRGDPGQPAGRLRRVPVRLQQRWVPLLAHWRLNSALVVVTVVSHACWEVWNMQCTFHARLSSSGVIGFH